MANEPLIDCVETSGQKGFTYRENIKRLNNAMRGGFYYEALLIDGALVEDRVHSYLYYLGVFQSRSNRSACGRTKKQLRSIQDQYLGPKSGLLVGHMSDKINLIRATLLWFQSLDCPPKDDTYLQALWHQYDRRLDVDGLADTLNRIDAWREYRNEVIHGLMNKNVTALDSILPDKCSEGQTLFRKMDDYVRQIKYQNAIRRSVKLPTKEKL